MSFGGKGKCTIKSCLRDRSPFFLLASPIYPVVAFHHEGSLTPIGFLARIRSQRAFESRNQHCAHGSLHDKRCIKEKDTKVKKSSCSDLNRFFHSLRVSQPSIKREKSGSATPLSLM
ncbi:unnamed protein product [Periconia digitata]|uniref:Uncharacterized protein n=1 Tax=Periconia digitata TaxID=1303443 RepID=A0A9W4XVN4_9PLEO|nr:unnamed protein product [Periconia digitata]